MSHCAPEATLKPKCFEFTLKTVITDVFIAQVYWEAVPKTWPGGSSVLIDARIWYQTNTVPVLYDTRGRNRRQKNGVDFWRRFLKRVPWVLTAAVIG